MIKPPKVRIAAPTAYTALMNPVLIIFLNPKKSPIVTPP